MACMGGCDELAALEFAVIGFERSMEAARDCITMLIKRGCAGVACSTRLENCPDLTDEFVPSVSPLTCEVLEIELE